MHNLVFAITAITLFFELGKSKIDPRNIFITFIYFSRLILKGRVKMSHQQYLPLLCFKPGYNKQITPPRINNTKLNKYVDSVKLEIHTTMKIHMLQHFDAVAHGFDAEFTLDLEWFDSRLKYRNLKSKPNINGLSSEEVSTIWFPKFVFVNTAKKDLGLVDEKAVFHVLKKGKGKRYEKERNTKKKEKKEKKKK